MIALASPSHKIPYPGTFSVGVNDYILLLFFQDLDVVGLLGKYCTLEKEEEEEEEGGEKEEEKEESGDRCLSSKKLVGELAVYRRETVASVCCCWLQMLPHEKETTTRTVCV